MSLATCGTCGFQTDDRDTMLAHLSAHRQPRSEEAAPQRDRLSVWLIVGAFLLLLGFAVGARLVFDGPPGITHRVALDTATSTSASATTTTSAVPAPTTTMPTVEPSPFVQVDGVPAVARPVATVGVTFPAAPPTTAPAPATPTTAPPPPASSTLPPTTTTTTTLPPTTTVTLPPTTTTIPPTTTTVTLPPVTTTTPTPPPST